ncbi:5'/3'-nucleotidase SurE [Spirillospora sp. NPDC127200]
MIKRVLVTNDDGIDSPGLHCLARTARDCGLEVVVAAPREEASGSGAGLTAVRREGRVAAEPRELPDLDGVPAYAVAAAPGYIALVGVNGAFGDPPDLVLSGINLGANAGHAVLHSGTVGAVLTARTNGVAGLAVSLDVGPDPRWDTAAAVAAEVLTSLLAVDAPVAVNLNVPNLPFPQVRPLRLAPLASFGAVQTMIAEHGQGFLRTAVEAVDPSGEPDSDAGLLARGHATVTFLEPVCQSAPPRGWRPPEPGSARS